jgi:autotransporter translocation and assembly factor TamB
VVIRKRVVYLSILIIAAGLLFFAARGPYISNSLKKLILPELELMTGRKVIAGKIYINILPLFAEMKDVTVFDEEGTKLLAVERVKGYVSLTGLFERKVVIKRLVIRNSDTHLSKSEIEEIIENVKKYLAIEKKDALKVEVDSIILDNANLDLHDGDKRISSKKTNAEVLVAANPTVNITLPEITAFIPGMPELSGSIEAMFSILKDTIDIKGLKIGAYGSRIKNSGSVVMSPPSGELKTDSNFPVESFKKLLGLKGRGDGSISVSGTVKAISFSARKDISLDLKLKGDLYLETLMELLKVTEKLEGHVTVKGDVKGALDDLHASARAELEKGNLFGVKLDSLACAIDYKDKAMRFSGAKASLYGGTATAEAMIALPVVNYYEFKVNAKKVNSKGIFELIKWDPGIAEGRVDGEISSEGSSFNPHGSFAYSRNLRGKDILERLSSIEGTFSMSENVLSLPKLSISSGASSASASGLVDLKKNTLLFRGTGTTSNVYDLSYPYFTALSGPGTFTAVLSGVAGDPVLDLQFRAANMKFLSGNMDMPNFLRPHTVSFSDFQGDVRYVKDLLTVRNFKAVSTGMTLKTNGNIRFSGAKHLFDIISPYHNLQISIDHGDLKDLSALFQGAPPLRGTFNTSFSLVGPGEKARASGQFRADNLIISDKYSLDKADSLLSFEKGEFTFKSLSLKKGPLVLNAAGTIDLDKKFVVSASAKNLDLYDLIPGTWQDKLKERNFKTLSLADVSINGSGTFGNPHLAVEGTLRYQNPAREQSSGSGRVRAELKGRDVWLAGNFMDGKIKIQSAANLDGSMPWRADIELLSARSDFLVAGFLRDIPEDLLINLKGTVKLHGDKNNINGSALLEKAYVYGYGSGFTNSKPIDITLQDRMLSVRSFAMKSEAAEMQLKGTMQMGKGFNLALEGTSSLAPLRAISKNIDVLKGDASFAVALTGDWDRPRLNGKMDVVNGALGLKSVPHRLTSVSAHIYAEEDRIIIEDAKGKVSGGDINLHGTVYLDRFSLKKFFVESSLSNVTVSVSKNFWVHFDGNLSYRGSLQTQDISGDININKARYTERIDWKSWLLQARKKERPKLEAGKFDQTALNIRVKGSNLSIDNNVARASMKMDMLLRGTMGQPALIGRFETINGIVYFRNNEFSLLKGAIDFANPTEINPFFDILAETRIKNYTVRLALDGYVDKFNLSLSSSPVLEEGDIFSLLAVGEVGKNLKGLEGGIGAAEATSFLTGKLQDVAEERLKTITGVDRLQIDPSISRTTGTVSPRVTLSKRLIGERLYATYSAAADVKEGQIIKLEYLLSKTTSLVGVRDAQGGIGADVKFRFEFK